jgi:hypothetical protein
MIYGELGRFPLYIDIKTRVISYWCKLLTGKATFDKPQLSNISFANFTQGADIFPLQKKICKSL